MSSVYKGWNAQITMGIGNTFGWENMMGVVGFCESVSCEVATGLEAYYQIGSRTPGTLVSGNLEITGSISRAWVDVTYLRLLNPSGGAEMQEFNLYFRAVGGPIVYLYGCKFERGAIDVPQDGFLTNDYDFRAMDIAFGA